jgi:hypothetical protein
MVRLSPDTIRSRRGDVPPILASWTVIGGGHFEEEWPLLLVDVSRVMASAVLEMSGQSQGKKAAETDAGGGPQRPLPARFGFKKQPDAGAP